MTEGFGYRTPDDDSREFVVPDGMPTDLASVPFLFSWLVARYGRHTRAGLVHDSFMRTREGRKYPRKFADWVFYRALEDPPPGEKVGSWTRHQLMWAAVCLFGTMKVQRKLLLALFITQLVAFWASVVVATAHWRLPVVHGHTWYLAAAIGVLGLLWRFNPGADRRLAGRLWPIALAGMPAVAPAVVWVGLTLALIWGVEVIPSVLAHRGVPPIGPTVKAPNVEFEPEEAS